MYLGVLCSVSALTDPRTVYGQHTHWEVDRGQESREGSSPQAPSCQQRAFGSSQKPKNYAQHFLPSSSPYKPTPVRSFSVQFFPPT